LGLLDHAVPLGIQDSTTLKKNTKKIELDNMEKLRNELDQAKQDASAAIQLRFVAE